MISIGNKRQVKRYVTNYAWEHNFSIPMRNRCQLYCLHQHKLNDDTYVMNGLEVTCDVWHDKYLKGDIQLKTYKKKRKVVS